MQRAAGGIVSGDRLSRVRVRCVGRAGAEETLLVPVPSAAGWTVEHLLQRVRERARLVPAEELEELELDAVQGGRLYPQDQLEDVLKDGDLLVCTAAQSAPPRQVLPPATASGPHGRPQTAIQRAGVWRSPAQAPARNAELEAGYARVFGDADGSGPEDEAAESDESPTPPAPGGGLGSHRAGAVPAAAAGRLPPRSGYGLWRRQLLARPGAAPRPAPAGAAEERSRSPVRRTQSEQAPGPPPPEGREAKWPPLLRAAYECDLRATEELLNQGADVNVTMAGAGQKTPIYYAIRFEVPDLVRLLLRHPDVDVHREMRLGRGGSWTTPLEAAREAGPSSGVYQAFVECGLIEDKNVEAPRRMGWLASAPAAGRRAGYGQWAPEGGEERAPEGGEGGGWRGW